MFSTSNRTVIARGKIYGYTNITKTNRFTGNERFNRFTTDQGSNRFAAYTSVDRFTVTNITSAKNYYSSQYTQIFKQFQYEQVYSHTTTFYQVVQNS